MAKQKPDLSNPFAKTEPGEPQAERPELARPSRSKRRRKPEDPVKSMGVGLRVSEWDRLRQIANELGLGEDGLHPLAVWVLRDFIRRYEAGEVKPPTETRTVLK